MGPAPSLKISLSLGLVVRSDAAATGAIRPSYHRRPTWSPATSPRTPSCQERPDRWGEGGFHAHGSVLDSAALGSSLFGGLMARPQRARRPTKHSSRYILITVAALALLATMSRHERRAATPLSFVAKLKNTVCTHTGAFYDLGTHDTTARMTENGSKSNYMAIKGSFQHRDGSTMGDPRELRALQERHVRQQCRVPHAQPAVRMGVQGHRRGRDVPLADQVRVVGPALGTGCQGRHEEEDDELLHGVTWLGGPSGHSPLRTMSAGLSIATRGDRPATSMRVGLGSDSRAGNRSERVGPLPRAGRRNLGSTLCDTIASRGRPSTRRQGPP